MAAPGVVSLHRLRSPFTSLERIAYGIPLGTVASSLGLLALACGLGLSRALVVSWGLACVVGAGLLARRGRGSPAAGGLSGSPSSLHTAGPTLAAAILLLALVVARWAVLWSGVLTVDRVGLWAGFINLWGDWSQHLGDVASFAYGDNFPPVHPRLSGHPFAYHYLTSVTCAAMVKLGLDPIVALPLHSFLFSVAVTLALYAFARRVSGDVPAALLATALFLVGGGWGWWLPLRGALASSDPLGALLLHPWDRAAEEAANLRWPNVYYALIAPQRAALYGLPLGVLTLRLLDGAVREGERRLFLAAGVVAGLLPMAHQGTLLALALTTPFLWWLFPTWRWILYFAVWIGLAAPQLLLINHGAPGVLGALRFHAGWVAHPDPWPWFWLKNLGLFLPLGVVGLLWRDAWPASSRRFLLALMPAFAAANLLLFQPWAWDNTKALTYWYFAICILSAMVLVRVWRTWRAPVARLAVTAALGSMLLSGLLIELNQLMGRERTLMLTREEMTLARRIREHTPAHALFAVEPRHNHPVSVLTGRRVLMGFPGWLWSQGMDYRRQERDLRAILAFAPGTPQLLARNGVDYVVVGRGERGRWGAGLDAYAAKYPCVIRTASYRVFAVGVTASASTTGVARRRPG
jgi:hypothetical protein